MDSLPELRQSLSQLLEILRSNDALFRQKETDVPKDDKKSNDNTAANTVFAIPEILAQIFLFALPSELYAEILPDVAPLNISQVCKFWRAVAIGFPPLWRSFSLTFGGEKHSEYRTELFLLLIGRARKYSLSAKLIFGESRGERITQKVVDIATSVLFTIIENNILLNNVYFVIPPECAQLISIILAAQPPNNVRSLAIDIFGNHKAQRTLEDFNLQSLLRFSSLKSLILLNYTVAFPNGNIRLSSLRQLVLVYDYLPGCEAGDRTRLNSHHCLNALRCFPSLETLCVSLHWSATGEAANSQIRNRCTSVEHDNLKALCIIAGDSFGELDAFLGFLNLPCLISFELRCRATATLSDGFQRFMGNSTMLESVAFFGRITPADVILKSLAILPNLKHLTLAQLPHILSLLEALSYPSVQDMLRMDQRRICRDVESLTIEDVPGNTISLDVLSHFIRSRRWFEDRTVRGVPKPDHPVSLKLLRLPFEQAGDLLLVDGIRECVKNGLKIERYPEEHVCFILCQFFISLYLPYRHQNPAYLSGKDFFHL